MDWFSLSLVLALGVLFVVTVVMVSVSIAVNVRSGQSFRKSLEQRVSGLRLGKMVQGLGQSPTRYVHQVPVVDVERQIRRCSGCANTERCDSVLEQSELETAPDFCANAEDLGGLRPAVREAA